METLTSGDAVGVEGVQNVPTNILTAVRQASHLSVQVPSLTETPAGTKTSVLSQRENLIRVCLEAWY